MSIPTDNALPSGARTGRFNQRQRTRQAVPQLAQRLVESGQEPTVTEAADAAMASRATAYRYFPVQDELLVRCTFHSGSPSPEELFTRPETPTGAEDRVAYVHDYFHDCIRDGETHFRP